MSVGLTYKKALDNVHADAGTIKAAQSRRRKTTDKRTGKTETIHVGKLRGKSA